MTSSESSTDRTGTAPEGLVRRLLEPLLDARQHPATDQFDEVLAVAVGAGRMTPELARELRFWQRASVHEVSDHVRTVVPAVLPAALAAVAESDRDAAEAAAGARDAWDARQQPSPAVDDAQVSPAAPASDPVADPATAERGEAEDDPGDQGEPPAETPLSTPPQDGAAMSPHARRRLFVAGLTSTA